MDAGYGPALGSSFWRFASHNDQISLHHFNGMTPSTALSRDSSHTAEKQPSLLGAGFLLNSHTVSTSPNDLLHVRIGKSVIRQETSVLLAAHDGRASFILCIFCFEWKKAVPLKRNPPRRWRASIGMFYHTQLSVAYLNDAGLTSMPCCNHCNPELGLRGRFRKEFLWHTFVTRSELTFTDAPMTADFAGY